MNTYGWDTVSLIAMSSVNVAMANNGDKLAMVFDISLGTEPTVSAKGEFSSWSIVPGGSGQLLHLSLAIQKGALSVGANPSNPVLLQFFPDHPAALVKEYDLSGVSVILSVDLRLLRDSETAGTNVEFDMGKVGYTQPPPGPGYVTPVTVLDPSGSLDTVAKSLLGVALAEYLVSNADQVRYVFAYINPVPPGTDSWLAPTGSRYAYLERNNGLSYLGILSMTNGQDPAAYPPTVDPGAIRDVYAQSYVISGDLTLAKVILPILPTAYSTDVSAFYFNAADHSIRNTHTFGTFSVKSGAITYHPKITNFEMRIQGDTLRTTVRGTCDLYAGIEMTFWVGSVNRAVYDHASKELRFLPDPNPSSSYNADIPWYYWFISPLAVLIAELIVSNISSSIAEHLNNLVRSALAVTQHPPRVVEWMGTDRFDVELAGLDDALYIMGKPMAQQ